MLNLSNFDTYDLVILLMGSIIAGILSFSNYEEWESNMYPTIIKVLYAINAMLSSYVYIIYYLLISI